MSVLAIPGAISSAVSALSNRGHKGVHGSMNPTDNSQSSSDQSGTTQGLFGSLMDFAEQTVGIQTPTNAGTTAGAVAASGAATAHASKLSPAAMITAARSALP